MKITSIRRSRTLSIRTRVLTLALVPSIVFLVAGVLGAGYLIFDAAKTRNYYQTASTAQDQALPLILSIQQERRLTLRTLASTGTFQSELIKQRAVTDATAKRAIEALGELSGVATDQVNRSIREFGALMAELPETRARVDGGQVTLTDAAAVYNGVVDQFVAGAKGLAQSAPDAEIAYRQMIVAPLLGSIDLMQRSDALAAADLAGGLSNADFSTYQGQVAAYHLQLEETIPLTEPAVQAQYRTLTGSPAWLRLMSVESSLVRGDPNLPISTDLWRGAAGDVGLAFTRMLQTQNDSTNGLALDKVNGTLTESILAGVGVLVVVAAVFVFALRLSRRLIERLVRLRTETLELAEQRLPQLVEQVRTGADVRVDDVKLGEYGGDEIGEVANAFNKAQQTAVASAVQEAKTREGTNKVFLNIAHRSQVIVHRQLKTLDEAERQQEDPEQLELLFQLDHLTTRQRRNAENLIILGGGQPGRRWRNPVSLTEVVRGAAAETEDFARVKAAKLPSLTVIGPVVGDLVHLLAELIDNATSFSPPGSRVDVRGNVVGRGVVLEIEDQGLGIEADRVDDFNNMLANPPDFGIMALSSEPRLGLFVVARLAARHGIGVTLRESAYGGTRAIVLVRNDLLGKDSDVPEVTSKLKKTNGKQVPPESPAERTDTTLKPVATGPAPEPGRSIKLSIPGAVNLPDLPMVEPRPGEDLFRPHQPADAENKPSLPVRRPRKPEPPAEPPRAPATHTAEPDVGQPVPEPEPPAPLNADMRSGNGQHSLDVSQLDTDAGQHSLDVSRLAPLDPEATQQSPELSRPAPLDADTRQHPPVQPPPFAASAPTGRPALPQRRRQQNLAPQLREDPAPEWPPSRSNPEHNREDSPEQARSRLAAFQAGTRRGRHEQVADDTDTIGSARNGQHRSE